MKVLQRPTRRLGLVLFETGLSLSPQDPLCNDGIISSLPPQKNLKPLHAPTAVLSSAQTTQRQQPICLK